GQDHWQALKHHGTRRVVIAYDRDAAGDAAAATLGEALRGAGIEVFRLLFPQGLDANAFARQVESPAQALGELLQRALWQGKGVASEADDASSSAAAPQAVALCEPESVVVSVPVQPSVSAALATEPESVVVSTEPLTPMPGAAVGQPQSVVESFSENAQGDLLLTVADRHWRVRGWKKNLGPEQ
ncbi:toprim domain-containing protein, partial [Stutzerimonas kirkiae]|uniref:toprim domain-containing protein n=1 Tax=Stutzerimonas kirkiae TaxID=2211392 RepID=UPI0010DC962A